MTVRDQLGDVIAHLEWADSTLWQTVLEPVDRPIDSKVEFWLHHVHSVQHAFLCLWRDEPVEVPELSEFTDPEALLAWGRRAHSGLGDYLEQAEESDLVRALDIPWTEALQTEWGRSIEPVTVAESALQVAMHSAHHRGQVAARLRELSIDPPLIDYIYWVWVGRPRVER